MTTKVKAPPIHAIGGLLKMKDGVLSPYLDGTVKGLKANTAIYTKPPIDLDTYGNAVSGYDEGITAALDGGRTAVAQKNKLKHAAIKLYDQLAKYVEANCNDDLTTFLLSGFKARSTTKTPISPASSSIRKLEHGANSGEINATLIKVADAASYEVRSAPVPAGAAPTAWIITPIPTLKPPTKITGLTPGLTYAFQARALLKTGGYSDWSDSATLMCM
jgi:hypothetical protein